MPGQARQDTGKSISYILTHCHPIAAVGTQRIALDRVSMRLRIVARQDTNAHADTPKYEPQSGGKHTAVGEADRRKPTDNDKIEWHIGQKNIAHSFKKHCS